MLRTRSNNSLTEFHLQSLHEIQRIRKEHGVKNGFGSFLAKRRAIRVIRKEVNVQAGHYGIAYDLKGRILNFGRLNVDFLMTAHNPIMVTSAA